MDDWDAVSSPVEDTGATDPWDAVSTPQPKRPLKQVRQSVTLTISRRFVLLVLAGLLIAALASGIAFTVYRVSGIHTANVNATATAQAMATAHVSATATTLQKILYIQATNGTPMIDDPLSNNNMGYAWGVLTLSFGGTCFFTGTDYHISIPNSGYYWMWCAGRNIYLNNFAFQVQVSMTKPGDGGIVFGYTASGFYRMDLGSAGTFTLLQYTQNNNQTQTLLHGSNPAIKSGLNQVNVMTIIVNNSNLYFYVNSQFIMGANLSAYGLSYKTGTFGFAAQNFGQPTEVVFTNLKVWSVL